MRRLLSILAVVGAALGPARGETLTVADCLREVAEHNPAIETQRTEMAAALGTRLSFRSRALPRLSVAAQGGQQGDEGTSVDRAGEVDGVQVGDNRVNRGSRFVAIGTAQLLQPIFDVGIPPAWRRGNIEIAIARANFISTASTQLHQARVLFYQALYFRESGRLFDEQNGRLETNAKTVGDLVKAGLTNRQGLLQAQVARANNQPSALAASGSYETSLAALWRLMGRETRAGSSDPLRKVTLDGSLDAAHTPVFDAAAVAPGALARRPDLQSVREVIRAFTEDAKTARADYYPLFQLIINGQALPQNFVRSERPNALRSGDEISTTEIRFGARYSWMIVDTGEVRGGAQRIDRQREGLQASLRRLEFDVSLDLASLKAKTEELNQQGATFRDNLSTADDTLKIVSDAVRQGTSSQIEVIDAESGSLGAHLGLLDVQLQTNLAQAEFDRITGGYVRWVEEPTPAASPSGRSKTDKDR